MIAILKKIRNLFVHEQWQIAVHPLANENPLLAHSSLSPCWIPQSGLNTFNADPFGICRDGYLYVFYEKFFYLPWRGEIWCIRMDIDTLKVVDDQPVIVEPFHLSYPFLVEDGGRLLCIPEAANQGRVFAYECIEFPSKWKRAFTLLNDFPGVDNTLIYREGFWWMFNTPLGKQSNTSLHVWFAERLKGPWHAHPANPVKMDISSSRPAGTLFTANGELYRPAQDCSKTYGGAVVINRVVELNTDRYREEISGVVNPLPPYNRGLHTFSVVDNSLILLDGKRHCFSIYAMAGKAGYQFRKIRRKITPWFI